MSIRTTRQNVVTGKVYPAKTVVAPWVRNASWLTMTSMGDSDNKFVGLYAIYDDGANFVALTAAGNFNVDWGDGTNENVNSGVTAERNISYASVTNTTDVGIADDIACTFQDTGDTVTLTAHGWVNGQIVALSSITSTTGISTYTSYYIVGKTADTFQLATTIGGSAIALTTDGSGRVYVPKYRQVLITVTPQAGQTFTSIDIQKRHSQATLTAHSAPWLDISIAGSSLTTITVCQQAAIKLLSLETFSLYANSVTDFTNMFNSCYSLTSIPLLNTAAGTTFTSMFSGCYSLTSIPLLNTAAGTNFSSMFSSCLSLVSIPLLNTAAGTNFSSMFSSCYSLTSIPLLNTAAGTNFSSMFSSCYSLTSIPLLNTAAGTTFTSMFNLCPSISRGTLNGTAQIISYSACKLSGAALDEIYTNLATVVGKTITVSGNWGTATDNPTIATAKGWTVTG